MCIFVCVCVCVCVFVKWMIALNRGPSEGFAKGRGWKGLRLVFHISRCWYEEYAVPVAVFVTAISIRTHSVCIPENTCMPLHTCKCVLWSVNVSYQAHASWYVSVNVRIHYGRCEWISGIDVYVCIHGNVCAQYVPVYVYQHVNWRVEVLPWAWSGDWCMC